MAVYVDLFPAISVKNVRGTFCAHMIADTEEELDEMAVKIGLKPEWKQKSRSGIVHYDLSPNKRNKAVLCDAIEITTRELIMKWKENNY